jgi:hypothetical protein
MTLTSVTFSDIGSLVNALASVKVLHLQMGADDGLGGAIQDGDDYHLAVHRIGRYDREETLKLQLAEHLEKKKTVAQLKGLFPEGVGHAVDLEKKPQLVRGLLRAYTTDEDGLRALCQKLRIGQRVLETPQWMLVFSSYKIRSAHANAINNIRRRGGHADPNAFHMSKIDFDVQHPEHSEGLPRSWGGCDHRDMLVSGVHHRSSQSHGRSHSVPGRGPRRCADKLAGADLVNRVC